MKLKTNESFRKLMKQGVCFFGKINKIDKPLARLTRNREVKSLVTSIRNDKGEITIDATDTRDYLWILPETLGPEIWQCEGNGSIFGITPSP